MYPFPALLRMPHLLSPCPASPHAPPSSACLTSPNYVPRPLLMPQPPPYAHLISTCPPPLTMPHLISPCTTLLSPCPTLLSPCPTLLHTSHPLSPCPTPPPHALPSSICPPPLPMSHLLSKYLPPLTMSHLLSTCTASPLHAPPPLSMFRLLFLSPLLLSCHRLSRSKNY